MAELAVNDDEAARKEDITERRRRQARDYFNAFREYEVPTPAAADGNDDNTKADGDGDTKYIGLVYELIENAENEVAVVQQVLDFFWRVGFARTKSWHAANWTDSIVVDYSDIV